MSTSIHKLLLRPGRLFFFISFWTILLSSIGAQMAAEQREGARAFLWLGLIMPLALGIPFAAVIHEAMHRPSAGVLPGARRRFLRSHAMVIGCGAAICATLAYLGDRTLAIVPVIAIALALMTVPLPFEPGGRFAGSRLLAAAIIVATAGTLMFAAALKDFAVASPLIISAVGFGVAALNLRVAFSTARLRDRAKVPHTPYFSAALTPQFAERIKRDALLRNSIAPTRWRPLASQQAIRNWVRGALYERFGNHRGGWWGMMLVFGLGVVVAGIFLTVKDTERLSRPQSTNTFFIFLLVFFAKTAGGLRASVLYPLSRTRRARVAFATSAWQLTINFAMVLAAAWLSGVIVSLWLGQEMQWIQFRHSAAALLFGFVFAPLAQWGQLHSEVQREAKVPFVCTSLALTGALIANQLSREWPTLLLSPAAITFAVLLVGLSQFAYYTALMQFYRRGDLVQRAPQEARFGLI